MGSKFIEYYEYEGLSFKITLEGNNYYARFQEIVTYSDDLKDLKEIKIPNQYHASRVFKL
ncbi:hypothetical protein [Clostridium intestinale]|uniref:hypothetical protein n=1 Tax=Clostridium intestinale TaxID=36845 RepID=UPI0028ED83B8|nr:hypothetical protein [Clostridium intestinale]